VSDDQHKPTKLDLRLRCWEAIRAAGVARFPGVRGRIPNFVGAEAAAKSLSELPEWTDASTLKCNPDSPQRPVRVLALRAGKTLYVPAPKLAGEHPFIELDPADIDPKKLWHASSIKGAFELGRPVRAEEVRPLDLIVTGCVGVTAEGARLGKGGGYSDLEYAMLRELGLVDGDTPILTTVHDSQVLPDGSVPMTVHDISLDLIVTNSRVIRCPRPWTRPVGVLWDRLDAEKIAGIPVLAARRKGR
jgi:5-formyltetrahydrofolate cyclo-ligase